MKMGLVENVLGGSQILACVVEMLEWENGQTANGQMGKRARGVAIGVGWGCNGRVGWG